MVNLCSRGAKEHVGPVAVSPPDDGETIYVVDEERGALTAYDWGTGCWMMVAESEHVKGAVEVTVGGGKACVVAPGGGKVLIVDITPPLKTSPAARRESWAAHVGGGGAGREAGGGTRSTRSSAVVAVGELRARRQVDEGAKGNLSKVAFWHVIFG
uniref:Uncharacterized protein n=1 Tax=Oryza meridionalis TaxID=40149 RepID=A0A0E0DUG8_9ORYZ